MSNMTTMAGNDSDDNFGTTQYMPTLPNVTEPFSPSSIYVKTPDIQYWICTVILTAVGIVGNAMAFALMGDVKFSSLSYPVYLRFLAVADSAVLLSFCTYQSLRFFHSFYIIGMYVAACRVWMFFMFTAMLLSPWFVVGLTLDRFFCVVFPLNLDRFCTRRKAKIVCSCLAALSTLLMLPLLQGIRIVEESNICFIEDHLVVYFGFVRLVFNSNLPCLLILIFNIVIGIHIQRSISFRKRFTSTSSGSKEQKKDKSLRPLMLISVLALLSLLPSSLADSVVVILLITKSDSNTLNVVTKFSPSFNILYLVNFAQNFYILMASSPNYRNIIKRKLNCKIACRCKAYANGNRSPACMSEFVDCRPNVTEESNSRSLPNTKPMSVCSPISSFDDGLSKLD